MVSAVGEKAKLDNNIEKDKVANKINHSYKQLITKVSLHKTQLPFLLMKSASQFPKIPLVRI